MIDKKKNIEFGIVLSLAILVIAYICKQNWTQWAIVTLVLTLLVPKTFTPFAWLWMKFGEALSQITTSILLAIVFFGIVTPIGKLRALLKKDSLRLRDFKKCKESVFIQPDKMYSSADLEKQF